MSNRTFKVQDDPMHGKDIESWEHELVGLFKGIGIDAPIVANGIYGDVDRSYTKSFVYAIGLETSEMDHGLTAKLRSKLRNRDLTDRQKHVMSDRTDWRRRLRERYRKLAEEGGDVSLFVTKLLQDSWGFHPGVHDGIDLITLPDAVLFAPVKSKVFDVRDKGWWGLGAPANPVLKAKGDGIIQLEILEDVGPFKKGYHIGFGHAEKALVEEGDTVKAGTPIGHSGFANAWHTHLVYNDGTTEQGRGTIDPRPLVDYSIKHD